MLAQGDIDALLAARHADPFAALGLHADATGKLWIRALLPGADAVELLDAASGRSLTDLLHHRDGFFEARVPLRRKRFDYRLKVRWHDGSVGTYADTFAFGPQISEDALLAFREGRELRPQNFLGAHPCTIDGSVSAVVPFGLFVALDDVFVEGLVHISDLGSDYFHYDDAHHSLVGERTGERYRLSDRVRVQLMHT